MDTSGSIQPLLLLLVSISVCVVTGAPIDCGLGSDVDLGELAEGYEGVVEEVTGIPVGHTVSLVSYRFPEHLDFVGLSFTPGETNVIVRTRKPLDADVLGDTLYYTILCEKDSSQHNNKREVKIIENGPIFEKGHQSTTVSERHLNYNMALRYNFMVTARDDRGLKDIATVLIQDKDSDDLNPSFSHNIYRAFIQENQSGPFWTIEPEQIKAQDGDTGINIAVTYSISEVFPDQYVGTFSIDSSTGVMSVEIPIDREEMTTEVILVSIKVEAVDQATDGLSSTAQLIITVLDDNDNAPQFPEIPDPLQISEGDYTEAATGEIFFIVPTDADVGLNGEVTVSLASPHPLFRFREDGMLLAVGSLDRESRETYELIIKASDKGSPQRESFIIVRVNLTDVNDNRPEFSSDSYVSSILLKDAVEGKLLLTLSATDRDVGNNALITYSFQAGLHYLALNSETGAVTLTSDLVDITKDTKLELKAMAEDHGQPPLSSTASVTVNLRVSNIVEGVFFTDSSYSFIVRENQPAGAAVGRVFATSGSDRYNVTYSLKNHHDLFNISTDGSIQTRVTLDKEEEEWYVLDVEAVDTRTPPTSAVATVIVQVENVNESPYFQEKEYNGSVFSIAPYKTPIIQVQASDPDLCDVSQLVYNMSVGKPHFNVEPSTGLVYLVSIAGLNQSNLSLEVQATDLGGLQATVKVEVEIWTSTSGDKVTLWLSLTADTVEENWEMLEVGLGEVLDYTVTIIEVTGVDGEDGGHSLVTFIATLDNSSNEFTNDTDEAPEHFVEITKLTGPSGGTLNSTTHSTAAVRREIVSSELVIAKVNTLAEKLKEALAEVFGEPVAFAVNQDPQGPDQAINFVEVVLGVLLGLSMLGLTLASAFIIRNKRTEKKQKDEISSIWDFPAAFERRDNDQNRNRKMEKTYKGEDTSSLDFPVTFKGSGSYQNRNKRKEKKHKDEDTGSLDFPVTFKRSRSSQKRIKKKKKHKESGSEHFDLPSVKVQ